MESQSEQPVLRPTVHPLECSPLTASRTPSDIMSPCDAARKERRRPPSLFGGTPSCSPKPRPSAASNGTSPNNPIVGFAPIVGQLPSSTTAFSANASFALPQGQSTASVPSSCRTQPCSIHGLTGIRVEGKTLKIGSFVVSDKGCSSARNLLLVMNPCLPKPEPVATPPLRSSKQEEPVSPLFYTNDEFPSQSLPSTAHVSVETSPQMIPNALGANISGGFKSVPIPLVIGTPITRKTPTHHHVCPSPQHRGMLPSPVPPMTPMLSALHAPLKYHDLVVEDRVDSGASGTVFKAMHKEHNKYFAVKRISLSELVDNPSLASGKNPRLRQLQSIVHRELQILHSEYRSAYIIKTYNAFFDADNSCLNIVMEFMDYGSLDRLGHLLYEAQHPDATTSDSDRSPLPERMLAVVAEQVLTGLRDMHERGHVHRDIKPSNVLINRAGITKLSDFGLTECVDVVGSQGRRGSNGGGDHASNHSFHSNVSASAISDIDRCTCHDGMDEDDAAIALCSGTDRYMSPERQRGESHGPPSDIWSFGMTLAECAVGYYPIDTSKCQDEFERMDAMKKVVFTDADSKRLSSEFKDFIIQAMALDETKRPSAVELLDHPWFAMWEGTYSLAQKLRDTLSPHVTFSPVGARVPYLGMLLPPASTPGGRPPPTASPTAVSVATMPIIDRLQGQSPFKGRLPPFGQTPPSEDSSHGPPVWREHTRDI